MATANAAATLARADDWVADFATQEMKVLAGANVLATHTLAGFVTSNDVNDALATANAISDETITGAGTQTADSATISDGTKTYTLSVGTTGSGADLILSTLTYINGETSSINSLVARFKSASA